MITCETVDRGNAQFRISMTNSSFLVDRVENQLARQSTPFLIFDQQKPNDTTKKNTFGIFLGPIWMVTPPFIKKFEILFFT